MDPHVTAKLMPYVLPLLVVVLVMRRLIRNEPRKVTPRRLFVLPLILAFAAFLTLKQSPAPGAVWLLIFALAAMLGAGVGYLSGRHREFSLDTESGEIMGRATPIGSIIFAALFVLRSGLKLAFPQLNATQAYGHSAMAHPAASAIGWTEAGLVFSTAMILATAVTTWLRTRHLVVERERRPKVAAVEEHTKRE
jgi:ABC-type Na+ efflux pump permease subunit